MGNLKSVIKILAMFDLNLIDEIYSQNLVFLYLRLSKFYLLELLPKQNFKFQMRVLNFKFCYFREALNFTRTLKACTVKNQQRGG